MSFWIICSLVAFFLGFYAMNIMSEAAFSRGESEIPPYLSRADLLFIAIFTIMGPIGLIIEIYLIAIIKTDEEWWEKPLFPFDEGED